MDLNVVDKGGNTAFRVRRVPTLTLIQSVIDSPSVKRHKTVLTELANRILMPFMNLILATLCVCVLLRSSLLRRRASMAPAVAVGLMAVVMALFMTGTNMIASITGLFVLAGLEFALLGVLLFILAKK